MTDAAPTTAREAYEQCRSDIARVLDWLDLEFDKHRVNAKAKPEAELWSDAGDLGEVRRRLIETLAFTSDSETQEIEALLSECR